MKGICDLHTHSTASDGSDSPKALWEKAHALGLGAIALCDHNTVAGLPEFLAAAHGNTKAVPGCEFTVDFEGTELHLLGLFIAPCHFAAVTEKMAESRPILRGRTQIPSFLMCEGAFLTSRTFL